MKIAYLVVGNLNYSPGVNKKISEQVNKWLEMGQDARIFCLTTDPIKAHNGIVQLAKQVHTRLLDSKLLVGEIESWHPDLIYARSGLTYNKYFNHLFSVFPTILEVNTDERNEYKLMYSRPKYAYFLATRHRYPSKAAGFIYVTRELRNKYKEYKKPNKIIANGIDLHKFSTLDCVAKEQPELIFVGTEGFPWHGVDRIIEMARIFPDWVFHMVGVKEKIDCAQDNVRLYGLLPYDEYIKLMMRADIAIGSLALYRNRMNEASPLKVREYLAHGLPVILGYQDTDFPLGSDFLLNLPNNEIDLLTEKNRIEEFVWKWQGRRVGKERVEVINSNKKEEDRLRFFKAIIEKGA